MRPCACACASACAARVTRRFGAGEEGEKAEDSEESSGWELEPETVAEVAVPEAARCFFAGLLRDCATGCGLSSRAASSSLTATATDEDGDEDDESGVASEVPTEGWGLRPDK